MYDTVPRIFPSSVMEVVGSAVPAPSITDSRSFARPAFADLLIDAVMGDRLSRFEGHAVAP